VSSRCKDVSGFDVIWATDRTGRVGSRVKNSDPVPSLMWFTPWYLALTHQRHECLHFYFSPAYRTVPIQRSRDTTKASRLRCSVQTPRCRILPVVTRGAAAEGRHKCLGDAILKCWWADRDLRWRIRCNLVTLTCFASRSGDRTLLLRQQLRSGHYQHITLAAVSHSFSTNRYSLCTKNKQNEQRKMKNRKR